MHQKVKAEILVPATFGFGTRVETGVVEFEYIGLDIDGDEYTSDTDWPGIFLRGDDALMAYVPALEYLLNNIDIDDDNDNVVEHTMHIESCKWLLGMLKKCSVVKDDE